MLRKQSFWNTLNTRSRKNHKKDARRSRRTSPFRSTILGVEWLEDRALLAAGDLATAFGTGGLVVDTLGETTKDKEIFASAVQADGKIVIAGLINNVATGRDFLVARYNLNGTLDTSFDTDGYATVSMSASNSDDWVNDIAIDSQGRIIVVGKGSNGTNDGLAIARLTPTGQLDTTFDGDGKLITILQKSPPANINSDANAVAIQSDGKIVVGGTTNTPGAGTNRDFVVARYNDDGALDTSFGAGGYNITDFDGAISGTADDFLRDIVIQSNGAIVAVGDAFTNDNVPAGSQDLAIARYDVNGVLDTSFGGGDGKVSVNISLNSQDFGYAVAIESSGTIVVAGHLVTGVSDYFIARFSSTGLLDASFAPASPLPGTLQIDILGATNSEPSLFIQPDGKYVIAGNVLITGLNNHYGVARVLTTGALDTSFSGDGKADTQFSGTTFHRVGELVLQADGTLVVAGWVQGSVREIALAGFQSGLNLSGAAVVNEGSTYTLYLSSELSGTDHEWTIDWGNGIETVDVVVVPGVPTAVTHTYPDGNFSYSISAQVTNGTTTMIAGNTVPIAVKNVAPTADAGEDQTVDEGVEVSLDGSFDDPAGVADTYTFLWEVSASNSQVVPDGTDEDFSFIPTDNGVYTITYTVTDDDGGSDSDVVVVTVDNADLTADAGDDQTVNEGAPVSLDGSFINPNGADTHTFLWQVSADNGDMVADGASENFNFTPADNGTYTITYTVTDDDGGSDSDVVVVTVDNVAPTANAGADQTVDEAEPVSLNGSFIDPGSADTHTFLWEVTASNGEVIPDGTDEDFDFTPTDSGTYTIIYTVTDDDGESHSDVVVVTVNSIGGPGQGTTLVGTVLHVIGTTTGTNSAIISVSGGNISVNGSFNGTNPVTFPLSSITEIVVQMGDSTDILITAGSINVPMIIDAGGGNDLITTGSGNDVIRGGGGIDIIYAGDGDDVLLGGTGNDDLIGGDGSDMLFGGSGRDLMIGSDDQDLLSAGDGDDILIGGITSYDDYDVAAKAAIDAVMAIWTSSASFNSRVSLLTASGGLLEANSKVFDDDNTDMILGGSGRDLVFGDNSPIGDGVQDLLSLSATQDVLVAIT